jgi:predicted amino acid-binding ACT domain protein
MGPAPVRYGVRQDWRWLYLVPCLTFLAVLLSGMVLGPLLFMGRVPNFGSVGITSDVSKTLPAVGLELAARQQMVTSTFLVLVAAVLLIAVSFRTSRAIFNELRSATAKTDAGRADYVLGLVVIVAGMAGFGLLASLRSNYCGVPDSNHL